jgi:hypothetical protein
VIHYRSEEKAGSRKGGTTSPLPHASKQLARFTGSTGLTNPTIELLCRYRGALKVGGVLPLLGWALPHKAPSSGHKCPLATHMQGAVLALPSQDRSHTCSVRDRPPQLCIDRKAGWQSPQPMGVLTSSMYPLDSRHAMIPGSSPYRRGATAASE